VRRSPRRTIAVVVVWTATFAGAASAQEQPPPPDDSAVVQYTEVVPTGTGPKAPGIGREKRGSLSPKTKKALEKAPKSTADSLIVVAISSNYGAPPTRPSRSKPRPTQRDVPGPGDELSLDRTLQATAAAAAPVDDARMIGLLVTMLAMAVGGGALAVRNRRA
jgi:hypothetical protein